MGRASDRTRWSAGRRRPYLLLGCVPFGASFALLWLVPPVSSQGALFGYYLAVYCLFSLAITVVSVPYLALLPEMARDYDERTSLNVYRTAASTLGILLAVGVRPLADAAGGGARGFAIVGAVAAVALVSPWLAVHRVSFEWPGHGLAGCGEGFWRELRSVLRSTTFARLVAVYLCSRVAMDVLAALLILYLTHWIGRSELFEPMMAGFLLTAITVLPCWLHFSRRRDKGRVFVAGALVWSGASSVLFLAQPGWPTPALLALGPLMAVGFAAIDLLPVSMLGEVIDEDDLGTGMRREGLYNGVFTFVRKAGAGVGVFAVFGILELVGFEGGMPQDEGTRQAIRALTAGAPVAFLSLAAWLARDFPLTRAVHREIRAQLRRRDAASVGEPDSRGPGAAPSTDSVDYALRDGRNRWA